MIVGEIGGIQKFCVDRVMAEMIIGVITKIAVKEISGLTAGIDFRGMIKVLTIEDTNLKMEVKMTTLAEGTTEIEKLVMVSDGTEFAGGNIEGLFDESRRSTKVKHEKWVKHYDRRKRDVQV
ncbi:hypothetical protein TNCV_1821161 [Trichonephila clavipes]|nr:hypothetical protein TNCV_1821161 [Trichonephila clavipes]